MSQHTARQDSHVKSRDEDADDPMTRPRDHKQGVHPRQAAGQPAAGGVGPDGPEEDEFELTGDDDLGPADLGPLGPHADPDAPSGRVRKITK